VKIETHCSRNSHDESEPAFMKVIPLGDKVVVKRLESEARTAGGIVLPDSAKEKPQQGRVLSVGDGRLLDNGKRYECQVQEGDRIIFSTWGGTEIKVDGQELLILKEDDVLAVLD
jgi:Co-chaperonin GroES (HSP10)